MRYKIILVPISVFFPSTTITYNIVEASIEGLYPLFLAFLNYINNVGEMLDEYGFVLVDTQTETILNLDLF
jgi:hypothetical protein